MDLDHFLNQVVRPSGQHKHLYHFTDIGNLNSIRSHGLLSTSSLRDRKLISGVITGGDENSLQSDINNGLDSYVRLCFTKNHPMAHAAANDGRQRNFTYLHIDPEIIKAAGALVTNAPSNQIGVVPMAVEPGLDQLDLEVIYKWMEWKNPEIKKRLDVAEKYEILIPSSVPLKLITNT
jgi:hypothetical protein